MNNWKKRIRAALGIGAVWGAAWFAVGMVLLFIVGLDAADVPFPLFFGLLGFLSGAVFSALLGLVARKRTFSQLSLPKFASWGAVGGALFAVVVGLLSGQISELPTLLIVFGTAGAVSATGTLAVARGANRGALEAARAEAELPELTEEERRHLPG